MLELAWTYLTRMTVFRIARMSDVTVNSRRAYSLSEHLFLTTLASPKVADAVVAGLALWANPSSQNALGHH